MTRNNARAVENDLPQNPIRTLHCMGHLLRGGIETWLFNVITSQKGNACVHHVLVRTIEEELFTDAFRKAGIEVLACPHYKNPVRYATGLKRLIDMHGPYDLLHVHGSSFSGLMTMMLAKVMGIKATIIHSHLDVRPHLTERGYLYRQYVSLVLKGYRLLADSGFAASRVAAESMFGQDWPADNRWELLYYGVDCRPFTAPPDPLLRSRLGIKQNAFVIGHVGRFHEQKNHEFLIDIIAAASKLNCDVHCLLIGDGPLRSRVIADIEARNLQGHFTFVRDTPSVSTYMMNAMDTFVFPSRYEGLGLVVVEAQAAGLQCLISDRIPVEAVVVPSLVTTMSLDASPIEWAATAIALKVVGETSCQAEHVKTVEASRFNLDNCVAAMSSRYLELVH